MTEDEAKQRWCPFARQQAAFHTECAGNRKPDEGFNCVGSECMAWRWIDLDVVADDAEAFHRAVNEEHHGFCGLAGKP